MSAARTGGFENLRVVAFENRKSKEIATLIANQHGIPVIAPAMREIGLEENSAAFAFAEQLFAGRIDAVIFMTGVGARALLEALETRYPREKVVSALAAAVIVARGPKPIAVLRELKIPVAVIVPEPNTWREVLATLDRRPGGFAIEGKRVAVQEYGVVNEVFLAELRTRGAEVVRVPVYRWGLPDDLEPLRKALHEIVNREAHVILFTNAMQVESVLQVAAADGMEHNLRDALQRCVVCSVGPTCSEALAARNVRVDVEPEHPKMGALVYEAAQRAAVLLAAID
jgi:uroporphyrinogen-III synthase